MGILSKQFVSCWSESRIIAVVQHYDDGEKVGVINSLAQP